MNETEKKTAEAEVGKEPVAKTASPADAAAAAETIEAGAEAPPAAAQPSAAQPSAQPSADERIARLEKEVATLKDQGLRAMAEAENIRRRAQREREDTAKYAISGFAKELLAVSDNLRRAIEAVPAEARDGNDMLKNLLVGVEATERQLTSAFDRAGIKKLNPLGEPFDPNFHQVVFEVENTGKPAGTVVQVLQEGYTIHDRLLREAMVGVAKRGADETVQQKLDTKA